MENIVFSVIVPVYKVEKYLPLCLDSIYSQDAGERVEVILVDDGSPDACGEICEGYREKYPDITRVIHQENKGLGGARNTGIEAAQGEYLFFVDSDDTVAEGTFERIISEIESVHPDGVFFPVSFVSEEGVEVYREVLPYPDKTVVNPAVDKDMIVNPPQSWNKVFKRSLFVDNGIRFPERVWYEDLRTTAKVLCFCGKILYVEAPPYRYLQREGSIMNSGNVERNLEIIDAMRDLTDYFAKIGKYDFYREQLEILSVHNVLHFAAVRVAKSGGKKDTFDILRNYVLENFPKYKNNPRYNAMPLKKKLVCFLMRHRLYCVLKRIF